MVIKYFYLLTYFTSHRAIDFHWFSCRSRSFFLVSVFRSCIYVYSKNHLQSERSLFERLFNFINYVGDVCHFYKSCKTGNWRCPNHDFII